MKIKFLALCLVLAIFGTALASDKKTNQIAQKKAKTKVLIKTTHSWDGNPLIPYPQGQPQVTILRFSIPAGTSLPMHTHPVINAGVVISGELTVVTKTGKTLHLKAGDPIVEVVNTWHYGKNQGSEPVNIIVFYAGTKDLPITILEK
ncbi:MAG: cupin domain-containing protein [Desulfobacteraceae bacterium]|nr:cupin domain-containing protein [Desulfobacteraceae bacterium]